MSDERYEGPPKSHIEVWSDQYIETQQRMLRDAIKKARREQMERDCRAICRFCEQEWKLQFSCGHSQMPNTAHWRHPEPNVVCKANAIRRAFEEQK